MRMINLEMMGSSSVLNRRTRLGILDDAAALNNKSKNNHQEEDDPVFSPSSSSEVSSVVSSEDSDSFEEEVSSSSPTSDLSTSPSGPLQDMSSLLQELPYKRGLSKHYNGKSQSFTSLANVASLEDLAKPENPYNKKLKSCKSYGGLFLESHGSSSPSSPSSSSTHPGMIRGSSSSSRLISRKASRGSCSSLCVKRNSSFLGNRPPVPPPSRSASNSSFASLSNSQPPMFALGI